MSWGLGGKQKKNKDVVQRNKALEMFPKEHDYKTYFWI